ncbi:MAG: hypothetical protein RL427_1578 [Bacteroidota bacterium]|jgi:hypothetical protein
MKKIISLIVLFFLFNSCTSDSSPSYSLSFLPIGSVDIPTEFTLGETYPITVYYNRPTTCHYFNGLYYDKNLNTRTIAVESVVEYRDNCQDLSTTDAMDSYTFNFYVTSNGSYIFKFYQGKDDSGNDVFLEYEVPVN